MNAAVHQLPLVRDGLERVFLSHSSAARYDKCPSQWEKHYTERLEADATSVALGFGGAVDDGASAFIAAHAIGKDLDPTIIFDASFQKFVGSTKVKYPSTWSNGADDGFAIGRWLLEKFVAKWHELGYVAAIGLDGKPLVQLDLKVALPENVTYTSILDLVAITPDGQVLVIDLKTCAAGPTEEFSDTSDQLTGQQMVFEAHMKRFGIDHIDGVGFFPLLKKTIPKRSGTGPEALDPVVVPPRTVEEVDAYKQSLLWKADDIRRKRFPKRSLDAYNTPCDMCDFSDYCRTGSKEGLKVRPKRNRPDNSKQTIIEI